MSDRTYANVRPPTSTGTGRHAVRNESLEATIQRMATDSRLVGIELTARILALAIDAQGWTHKTAPVTKDGAHRKGTIV